MPIIPGIDLDSLSAPDVVESLDFEAIYQALVSDFSRLYPQFTAVLESDPVVKLLELAGYREMLIRARVNDAARSNLLAFAAGSDLDHLAAFYGVARLESEPDSRFRLRTQFQIAAIAGNGTRERYRQISLEASHYVLDAAVLQPAAGQVDIALWIADLAADEAGVALDHADYPALNAAHHEAVRAAVEAAFSGDDSRMLGVPLTVREAAPAPLDVSATIYRESTAPTDLAERLRAALPGRISEHAQLGRDAPRSWLLSLLHVSGVSRVELSAPADDLILLADQFIEAGNIEIHDGGVTW
jgi:phage-related baseplate assembly protein